MNPNTLADSTGQSWYRHFWPWFMVVLLATTVVAGIATVIIAFRNADPLVRDDYYREGMAINRRLSGEQAARRLGVRALLHVDGSRLSIHVEGVGVEQVAALVLELSHATLAERDLRIELDRSAAGQFAAVTPGVASGRYYATLRPIGAANDAWRITRTISLPTREGLEFVSASAP